MPHRSRGGLPPSQVFGSIIESFLAACECGSFTQAAKMLGISQSAVSQNVQKLEERIGLPLFDRDVRPIAPRPEATLLRDRLRHHCAEIENVIDMIRESRAIKRVIRIGIVDSLSEKLAPGLVRHLHDYAGQISIMSGIAPSIGGDLIHRDVDIIVSSDPMANVDGLRRHFLLREPSLLILPKAAPLSSLRSPTWRQLAEADLPLIRYSRRSASGRMVDAHLTRLRLHMPFSIEADTTRVMLELVRDGAGWALSTPICLLQGRDLLPELVLGETPRPQFQREIFLIARQEEPESLVDKVLHACRTLLIEEIVPEIDGLLPQFAGQLVCRGGD
ncbi:LysR-family transcriptional regulator [uncultured Alphaproteobacteria bacterium]|uniref:LysR-family transcriptional regulator n=1 Tax=uncultured Alphaproteobacteria bacterium TaxID=91750 RepID=A0A212KKJ1_9PROT|nr:LysR-family transcriptional regulator [uncultured Alphaproteobacteria bacterium]